MFIIIDETPIFVHVNVHCGAIRTRGRSGDERT
jgi:hypothetical protein